MSAIHRAIGIPSDGLVRQLIGEDDEKTVEAHSKRYEPLRDNVQPFPRTADMLQACADRGLAVVLATSGQESDLDWMLPAIGAGDAVTGATTSADVDEGKPAPDLLGTAIEAHGLDARRTVVVGDTVWDVEACERAGVPTIAVLSGGVSRGELETAGAQAVFDNLGDLCQHLDSTAIGALAKAVQTA